MYDLLYKYAYLGLYSQVLNLRENLKLITVTKQLCSPWSLHHLI